ncbi:MAG: mechanosensitive ion channel [Actinobacteria bacterium]|nr:mechanosensitive ion channel [Actinomycetota bacterium]
MGQQVADWGPRILLALAILAVGWIVARLLRSLTGKMFGSWARQLTLKFSKVFGSGEVDTRLQRSSTRDSVSKAVQSLVFWVVLLIAITIATEALGLNVVTEWLNKLVGYLPRILGALLVVLLGVLIATPVRTAVSAAAGSAGFAYPQVLGQMARFAILLVSVVVAFDQVGIEVDFLIVMAAVISGAMLGGAALAFGLGARTSVGNILATHYLHRTFKVGHHIRIGEVEGRILEITPTSVIVDAGEGRTVIPASRFSEQVAVVLSK